MQAHITAPHEPEHCQRLHAWRRSVERVSRALSAWPRVGAPLPIVTLAPAGRVLAPTGKRKRKRKRASSRAHARVLDEVEELVVVDVGEAVFGNDLARVAQVLVFAVLVVA